MVSHKVIIIRAKRNSSRPQDIIPECTGKNNHLTKESVKIYLDTLLGFVLTGKISTVQFSREQVDGCNKERP